MAEKDKKFYWLKLKNEFMTGDIVDFLMSQKNGANYVVLYEMLVIKTMNTKGRLCNEIGEVLIPFNPEKIQRECKWFDIDTVRIAMELYCRLGLIYKDKDDILQIANFEEMVGSESYWAKQKRIERQEKKCVGQMLDNVQDNVQKPLISNIYKSNISNSSIYNNKIKEENMATKWQPNGNQMAPQDSIGKDSIDKSSIEENSLDVVVNNNNNNITTTLEYLKTNFYDNIIEDEELNPYIDKEILAKRINESRFLKAMKVIKVSWLNKNYEKIIQGFYTDFVLKKEEPKFGTRQYDKNELDNLFDNLDDIQV